VITAAHRRRAGALPAPERRRHIVETPLPLLLEHGTDLTTRQIADAAGIAEGTIFRAFPDKESVIDAVLEAAFDPAPFEAALDGIDRATPLEQRLELAVDLLQQRVERLGELMTAAGRVGPPTAPDRRPPTSLGALERVIAPDADRLRFDPAVCARLLRGLTFAGTHPAFATAGPESPASIVDLLLDGVRSTGDGSDRPC
jgi:AcrR family transcriptional regulator